jgi:hypothetical protein
MSITALSVNTVNKYAYLKVKKPIHVSENINSSHSATFTVLEGSGIALYDEVQIQYNGEVLDYLFSGLVKEVNPIVIDSDTLEEEIVCEGYFRYVKNVKNAVTEEYISTEEEFGAIYEQGIINDLFDNYCSTINVDLAGTIVIPGEIIPYMAWEDASLVDCLNDLAELYNRIWWISPTVKYIYYIDPAAPLAATYGLSDDPDDETTFPFINLKYSQSDNGLDPGDGDYELVNQGTLKCWVNYLHVGQILPITSAKMSWTAKEFLITQVDTTVIDGVAEFTVTFVDCIVDTTVIDGVAEFTVTFVDCIPEA